MPSRTGWDTGAGADVSVRGARVPVDRTSTLAIILGAPPTRARNSTDTPAEHPRAGRVNRVLPAARNARGHSDHSSTAPLGAGRRSWHLPELVRLGGCPGVEGPFPSAGL